VPRNPPLVIASAVGANINFENSSMNNVQDFLKFLLDKKNENSIDSYVSIKNSIALYSIPNATIVIPAGTALIRGRVHDDPNKYFTQISEISHNQDLFKIKTFGRLNEPLQSIFYCSTNRETAFFEVSKIQKKKEIILEAITYGKWILQ